MDEKREEGVATEARGVAVLPADSDRDCLICDEKASVSLKFGRFHLWTIRLCEEHKAALLSALGMTALPDAGAFGPSPVALYRDFVCELERILRQTMKAKGLFSAEERTRDAKKAILEEIAKHLEFPDQVHVVPYGGGEIDGMEAWGTVEDVKLDEGDRVLIVRKRDPK